MPDVPTRNYGIIKGTSPHLDAVPAMQRLDEDHKYRKGCDTKMTENGCFCEPIEQSEFIVILVDLKKRIEADAEQCMAFEEDIYSRRNVFPDQLSPLDDDYIAWEDARKELANELSLMEDYIRCYERLYGRVPTECIPNIQIEGSDLP